MGGGCFGCLTGSRKSFKYVVLGGGNASGYAAKAFAERGIAPGELCIITAEKVVAYERPALSKGFLLGDTTLPAFHTCVGGGGERQTPDWYAARGITYLTSTAVTAADVAAKTLTTAAGKRIGYEKLIIATGCRVRTLVDAGLPGGGLPGVHYLRDLADGEALLEAMEACREAGGKAVVLGGGYIGLEAAAGLAASGLSVTLVASESRLMPRLFTPELSAFYEAFYASRGVTILKGTAAAALEGAGGKVARVALRNGDALPAALVVVGIGARPCGDLFAGQLEQAPDGGIVVDGCMRASHPDIYAIGDVAAFPLLLQGGARVRQEHVAHARASAAQAVDALMGGATASYDYLPFFYSRVFSLAWVFYGQSAGAPVHFGTRADGEAFGAFWVSEGHVVGGFLESGDAAANAAVKRIALQRPAVAESELGALAAQGVAYQFAAAGGGGAASAAGVHVAV